MLISGFGNILKTLYTDTMSITRYVETMNIDGTVDSSLSQSAIYTNVPCRISFSSTDPSESWKEDTNPKSLYIKIFCNASVDIQKGDEVIVSRIGEGGNILSTYKGKASLPVQYTTHKEVSLLQTGDA